MNLPLDSAKALLKQSPVRGSRKEHEKGNKTTRVVCSSLRTRIAIRDCAYGNRVQHRSFGARSVQSYLRPQRHRSTRPCARAPVRYRGLNVGAVRSIHFDPKHRGQIVIRIMLDRSVPITVSTFGSLQLQGVTGVAFVQLEDTEHSPGRLVSSVDHVAQIPMRPGFFDQLKERVDVSLQAKRNLVVDECVVAEILYANGRRHFTAHKFDHCRGRRCRARSGARD